MTLKEAVVTHIKIPPYDLCAERLLTMNQQECERK